MFIHNIRRDYVHLCKYLRITHVHTCEYGTFTKGGILSDIRYYLGAGASSADMWLNAFDRALMDAGCANYNLIRVSSILPGNAKLVDSIHSPEGSLLPTAYAVITASPNENIGVRLSAAIAVGIPEDKSKAGVIMEYSDYCDESIAKDKAVSMLRVAMEDRDIQLYDIKIASASKIHEGLNYTCVLALVSIMM